MVHDFKAPTAAGTPVAHSRHIEGLLMAIQLPSQVAVIKCKAHTYETDTVSMGYQIANEAAKRAVASLSSESCEVNKVMFFETYSVATSTAVFTAKKLI